MSGASALPDRTDALSRGGERAALGPLAQTVALSARMLSVVTAALALFWACGNLREVPPDQRAVVERFGRVVQVQNAGLLLAWPSPIETVRLVPGADRQIALPVAAEATPYATDETDLQLEQTDDVIHMERNRDGANAAYLLSGDGNVVRLDATLFFHITDPAAFVLAEPHVRPALHRLFLACSVRLSATHRLDDFLVAEPDAGGDDPALLARRAALRGELVALVNDRLAALDKQGINLGVSVSRIDLLAVLPPRAKAAFDGVLTASQIAEQNVAAARTDAENIRQQAERERDQVLADADAVADEHVRHASIVVAPVSALARSIAGQPAAMRDALVLQAWRDRIGSILRGAGDVVTVDGSGLGRLVLPGPVPATSAPGEGSRGAAP